MSRKFFRPLFLLALVPLLAVLFILVFRDARKARNENINLSRELGDLREAVEILQGDLARTRLREASLRERLGLPPIQDESENVEEEAEFDAETQFQVAFFAGAGLLVESRNLWMAQARLEELLEEEIPAALLSSGTLGVEGESLGEVVFGRDGERMGRLTVNAEGEAVFTAPEGWQAPWEGGTILEKLLEEEQERAAAEEKAARRREKAVRDLAVDPEIRRLVLNNGYSLRIFETQGGPRIVLRSPEGISLFQFGSSSMGLDIDGHLFENAEAWKRSVKSRIASDDLRPAHEEAVEKTKVLVETQMGDPAFLAFLRPSGLRPALSPPREDMDYWYYDIVDESGERAGAYAVHKADAEIYMMDAQDVPIRSLRTLSGGDLFFPGENPRLSPSPLSSTGKNRVFLVLGTHERNADAILLVHLRHDAITILSIPRELYFGGAILNRYYRDYGIVRFSQVLSDLTGLSFDGYVEVDMYAFIELVDLLGGLELTLEEDLIDPSYRIRRSDGSWGTLYYPAGAYTLNGIETLRVVRSRHGSSGFDRSHRQQIVLSSLKEKLAHIRDTGRFVQLVTTAMKYVESDIPPPTAVRILLSYRDVPVLGNNVLDASSVLVADWSGLYMLNEEEKERALADVNYPRGAWILTPVDGDWDTIRGWVREVLESAAKS